MSRGRVAFVIAGCALCQLGLGFTYLFGTYLQEIVQEYGWSRAGYSAAYASRIFIMALASPVAGWATERYGPRIVLSTGLVLLSSVGFGYVFIDAIWHLWALSLCGGLAMAALGDVAVAAAVARLVDKGRGFLLGVVYSASNVGGFLAVWLSGPIIEQEGWRASSMYLIGGGGLLLFPLALLLIRNTKSENAVSNVSSEEQEKKAKVESDPEEEGLDLSAAMRTRSFWLLFVVLFSFYFYYISILDHLVAILQDVGLSSSAARQGFAVAILLGIGSKLGIGWIFDKFPAKVGLLVNFGLVSLASILLIFVPAPGFLKLFVFVHGAATAAQNVSYPMVVADCFGVQHMAKIYGFLMLALLFGGLSGPIVAGATYDQFSHYKPALILFAGVNLTALLLLTLVKREVPAKAMSTKLTL